MTRNFIFLTLSILFTLSACSKNPASGPIVDRPNIVVILVDDAGLMDFGAFGGEADTPNIDALASQGLMMTNAHTSPMCAPSRAMLITGVDSHRTGVPNLPLFLPTSYRDKPGYEGVLNQDVKTLATRFREAGYATFMTGKWNLGHTDTTLPVHRGFDRSFILDASGADNWENRPYLPTQGQPPWFEDAEPSDLPDDFYSSEFLVDKLLQYITAEESGKPFFAYLSFQAIHIPVQAPRDFVQKYNGVYDEGWDVLRAQRFARAKELGLVPGSSALGDGLSVFPSWDSLSAEERQFAAKSMAVNAAMLDVMDFHIGRVVEELKASGDYDNTIFVVTSDNGPEGSNPAMLPGMNRWLDSVGYSREIDTLGEKGTFAFIGSQFASAAAGPSSYFKFYAGEGGLRVPLILSGPGIPVGTKDHAFTFVTDIAPTLLDLADVTIDPHDLSEPMTGRSLTPLFDGEVDAIYDDGDTIGMEAGGQAALFKGRFKLTRNNPPLGDGVWRLYDLSTDPGETNDLKNSDQARFQELLQDYENYANEHGVLEMPEGYELIKQIMINAQTGS